MAIGALVDIVVGLLTLSEVVGEDNPHPWRFLVGAWVLVAAIGAGFWRWQTVILASIGNWAVLGAVLWVLVTLYLIGATGASITFKRRRSKSRPEQAG